METITLPIELTNRNTGRGHHWSKSNADKQRILRMLAQLGFRRSKAYSVPVKLTVIRVLGPGQRLWDADSVLRGNWKEIQDSLVNLGWWHDDGPRWIRTCDGRQDANRRKAGPVIELRIEKL